jgi:UDP-galactopyranose mutase
VINYPNDYAFTRVTEFKHITGQEHPKTSIVYEYSRSEGDPYYPIPRAENAELYRKYQTLAAAEGVHFVGRLATYRYYNMDQVAAQALTLFAQMAGVGRAAAIELEYQPKLAAVTFPMHPNGVHAPARNGHKHDRFTGSRRRPVRLRARRLSSTG